jgi:CRP-like cAMP-binding protein
MQEASHHHLNRLLTSLPRGSFYRVRPHLRLVSMTPGQVLHSQWTRIEDVTFPTTAVVSLRSVSEDGTSAAIGMIGYEGMIGTSQLMGSINAGYQAVVQCAGVGYRLKAALLKAELENCPLVLDLVLRYVQSLVIQASQAAFCNRHHSVDQLLCRWLLLTLDRLSTDNLALTQELIAKTFGVRRVTVNLAAGKLRDSGAIEYCRGKITVLKRNVLEEGACECYSNVNEEGNTLLSNRLVPLRADLRPDSSTRISSRMLVPGIC